MAAPQYLMKAPVGVYSANGAGGKVFCIRNDGSGQAMVDADSCASLAAQGWAYADPVAQAAVSARAPYILAQSAVPTILLSSATNISATGAITGLTALPYVPVGVVRVYCFAQAGLAAGFYYATFSSTTACQLYLDAAATTTPTGITLGAYASGTTSVPLASITVPGGAMGPNGALRCSIDWGYSNSANGKTLAVGLGGASLFSSTRTTAASDGHLFTLRNRASQGAQGYYFSISPGGTNSNQYKQFAVDTSVDKVLTISAQLANAADFVTLEGYTIEVLPGA